MKPMRTVIFAKAPIPGLAKTRLIPALGACGAAELARKMLHHTVSKALAANVGVVELCVTPTPSDPTWEALDIAESVQWSDQGDGDLGARMARASQRVIDAGESILLIGTDCPSLSHTHLQQAAIALQHADAVLHTTYDGGYALLGLNQFDASLFTDMAWSTDRVAIETMCRLLELNWTVRSQRKLHDIDEPDDLQWLPAAWSTPVRKINKGVTDPSASVLQQMPCQQRQTLNTIFY